MKLQLAMDELPLDSMLKLIGDTKESVDIYEIGTPAIIRYGVPIIKDIRKVFSDIVILADTKIMDGGKIEAGYAIEAGADIVTVLSVAEDNTIKNVIEIAKQANIKTMVDMIAQKALISRSIEINAFGADYICLHTAVDIQSYGFNPIHDLCNVRENLPSGLLAVAGGINSEMLPSLAPYNPDIIIIGNAITKAKDPKFEARRIKSLFKT